MLQSAPVGRRLRCVGGERRLRRSDWNTSPFDVEPFRRGLDVELEHGTRDPETNVTGDEPLLTGTIALAHLRELPDYYTRLAEMEGEAGRG